MASVDEAIEKAASRLKLSLPQTLAISRDLNIAELEARHRSLQLFKRFAPPLRIDDERLSEQIRYAEKGDAQADACLRVAAAMFLEAGQQLPNSLGNYAARALCGGIPRRRRHRLQNRPRDVEITMCVYIITKLGFPPTRNAASRGREDRGMSACAIVAKALSKIGTHMSEEAIEKVWNKMAYFRS